MKATGLFSVITTAKPVLPSLNKNLETDGIIIASQERRLNHGHAWCH